MGGKIYILFACDQWKSNDSMRLACASTDSSRIMDVIEGELSSNNMSFFYGNSDEGESLSAFRTFRAEQPDLKFVNSSLEYGHLEIVEDGQVV